VNSPFCRFIILSIANPRVYHNALHTGSASNKKFGPHTFPKSVLHQLATAIEVQWHVPFLLPTHAASGNISSRLAYPKIFTIRFGTH
jgi:hypothetical protein